MSEKKDVRETVREGYAQIAKKGSWEGTRPASDGLESEECCSGGGCCGPVAVDAEALAEQIGYASEDLATLPDGANMGLSCGNPTAIAALTPGEVVLDLGAGGGFDAFLAGPRVGETGRVIGVDMTPDMVTKARGNLEAYRSRTGLDNVEFRLGEIEHLPVADASVDVILSNCVINLSPDKEQVWREVARVLKPGGRVAISDLALLKPLPDEVRGMVAALIGCVAGAVLVSDTERLVRDAGLTDVVLASNPDYIAAMTDFQDPLYRKIAGALPPDATPADYVTSLAVTARKPD